MALIILEANDNRQLENKYNEWEESPYKYNVSFNRNDETGTGGVTFEKVDIVGTVTVSNLDLAISNNRYCLLINYSVS